jgi:hypothetical protein
MGKVRWHVTMSLDGFIAGSNDSMDWVFGYVELPRPGAPGSTDSSEIQKTLEETIWTTGSVLSGRRS